MQECSKTAGKHANPGIAEVRDRIPDRQAGRWRGRQEGREAGRQEGREVERQAGREVGLAISIHLHSVATRRLCNEDAAMLSWAALVGAA